MAENTSLNVGTSTTFSLRGAGDHWVVWPALQIL